MKLTYVKRRMYEVRAVPPGHWDRCWELLFRLELTDREIRSRYHDPKHPWSVERLAAYYDLPPHRVEAIARGRKAV